MAKPTSHQCQWRQCNHRIEGRWVTDSPLTVRPSFNSATEDNADTEGKLQRLKSVPADKKGGIVQYSLPGRDRGTHVRNKTILLCESTAHLYYKWSYPWLKCTESSQVLQRPGVSITVLQAVHELNL